MKTWTPGLSLAVWTCFAPVQAQNFLLLPTVVSTRFLAHEVTKEPRKEFDLGYKAWRKSQFNSAQTHFPEAIRLDPGFLQALTGLAVVHLKLSRPELALNDLNRSDLSGPYFINAASQLRIAVKGFTVAPLFCRSTMHSSLA
jgi:hypothetical protein